MNTFLSQQSTWQPRDGVVKKDFMREDPKNRKQEAQKRYSEYMDADYQEDRNSRWSHWNLHYRNIDSIISQILRNNRQEIGNSNIEFLGLTNQDFIDGCIPLDKKIDTEQSDTIGELLLQARTLIFRNISVLESENAIHTLQECWGENGKAPPEIMIISDDITDGVVGYVESPMQNEHDTVATEKILSSMEDFYSGALNLLPIEESRTMPERKLGFSLMMQSATLAPLMGWIGNHLEQEFSQEINNAEQRLITENKIHEFLRRFNDWLLPYHLEDWFKNNPNGQYTFFMDVKKQYYEKDKDGSYNEEQTDELRSYWCVNPEFIKDLKRNGYNPEILNTWVWKDEPDHEHVVQAFTVTKSQEIRQGI